MNKLIQSLIACRLWTETHGQDMVEYALLAGFITVAAGATFPPVSSSISSIFSKLTSLMAATP